VLYDIGDGINATVRRAVSAPVVRPTVAVAFPRALSVLLLALVAGAAAGSWLAGLAIVVLAAIWRLVAEGNGPPVLALALTFQWAQVTCAPLYSAYSGRPIADLAQCDWEPMMAIGLVAVFVLALGLRLARGPGVHLGERHAVAISPTLWRVLIVVYVAATLGSGTLQGIAAKSGGLRQVISAVSLLRLGVLLVVMRQLLSPRLRPGALAAVLTLEVAVGITGFFSQFLDGLLLALTAMLEVFDSRRPRHWLALAALAALVVMLGAFWTDIKEQYRQDFRRPEFAASPTERLARVADLSERWLDEPAERTLKDVDKLMSRLWAIRVQAAALARVPAVVPHEDGALFGEALLHIVTPRLLFPDKHRLDDADNEMVRKYAGLRMAGTRQGTSVAFGYVAESYVDFGAIGVFVPIFAFGLFMGFAYRKLCAAIDNDLVRLLVVTPIFWSSLYYYERSWVKMLGTSIALLAVLGGLGLAIDRLARRHASSTDAGATS
jgi:hypothetical protein